MIFLRNVPFMRVLARAAAGRLSPVPLPKRFTRSCYC